MTDHLITTSAEQGPLDAEPQTKDKHGHCTAQDLLSRKYPGIDNPDFAERGSFAGENVLVYQCHLLVYIILYPLQAPDNVSPPHFFIYSQDHNLRHIYLGVSPTEQNRIYFQLNVYWNELCYTKNNNNMNTS